MNMGVAYTCARMTNDVTEMACEHEAYASSIRDFSRHLGLQRTGLLPQSLGRSDLEYDHPSAIC